jgi:hypothetical protein
MPRRAELGRLLMYWKHFLALERDLELISHYIEFDQRNFSVFSVELVKLLLALGSEIDVVLKTMCLDIDSTKKPDNINTCREIVLNKYPRLPQLRVQLIESSIILTPWVDWASSNNPKWWKAYNDVKHDRTHKYHLGNLFEVLNASAGLLVVVLYQLHFSERGTYNDRALVGSESKLFDTEENGEFQRSSTFSYILLV